MANFSSKKLIQDTGRKMGLATTVKRAQKRDPSEKTFFDKKRGKELAAVSKEDMKDYMQKKEKFDSNSKVEVEEDLPF